MKKDEIYLKHILEAINNIEKFVENLTEEEFLKKHRKTIRYLKRTRNNWGSNKEFK
jgi:uncharacterized protein with HEPN domain